MSIHLFPLEVREPIRFRALSVFPLYANTESSLDYLLADEAISNSSVVVEEISQQGNVPHLRVRNVTPRRVLFLEGEELLGAKRNRVLNTSVLVGALSELILPVSCVERGRWHSRSQSFSSSDHISTSDVRRRLKMSVYQSLKEKKGHRSDQGKIWEEVDRLGDKLDTMSPTSAMNDSYEANKKLFETAREQLEYPAGAIGVAVAIGSKMVAIDVFDKPSTCQKMWHRLLKGFLLESTVAPETEVTPSKSDVEQFLGVFSKSPWEQQPAVGEGIEERVEQPEGTGSALLVEDVPVHVSILSA